MVKTLGDLDSRLARGVKKPKTNGNILKDQQAQRLYKDTVFILNTIDLSPQHVASLAGFCRDLVDDAVKQRLKGDSAFERDIETLADVDNTYWEGFFTLHAGIKPERMIQVKMVDADGIRQLIQFTFKATLGCKVPREGNDQSVFEASLKQRGLAADCDRLAMVRDIVQETGALAWGKGVYRMRFEEGRYTKILHKPTGVREADDVIDGNWSDLRAKVVKGKKEFVLAKYFDKQTGPFKSKTYSGSCAEFAQLFVAAQTKVDEARATTKSGDTVRTAIAAAAASSAATSSGMSADKKAKLAEALKVRMGARTKRRRQPLRAASDPPVPDQKHVK